MSRNLSRASVALAHHWLVGMRGGEKVLEQICKIFPGAPVYTLIAEPVRLNGALRRHPLITSWLQRFPLATMHYKKLLPFFPWAVSSLRVTTPVDLLISSDASVIKGLSYPCNTPHLCYCHSPPRYLWDFQNDYANSAETGGPLGRALFNYIVPYVRDFDRRAADRVTHFIANSRFVRDRIFDHYGRKSQIIYPPVNLDGFSISSRLADYYLIVSQLVPYKRIDLAVLAFNRLNRKLIIIGEGAERRRLQKMARSNVTFLGAQSQAIVKSHFSHCQALIFPGIEDFGITPLESQASGRPVIAFRAGGALESIKEHETGLFFDEQTPDSLIDAVERFEKSKKMFDPVNCRKNAERFSADEFRGALRNYLIKLGLMPRSQKAVRLPSSLEVPKTRLGVR